MMSVRTRRAFWEKYDFSHIHLSQYFSPLTVEKNQNILVCTWSPRESKRRSEDAGVAAAKSDSFLYLHFGKEVMNSYCPFRPFLKAVSFHLSHHLCILSCTFSKTSAALTKISQKTQISGETVSQACSPSSNHKFCISIKWINMAWFRTI